MERAEEVLGFLAKVFEAGRNGLWDEFESLHSPAYTRFSDHRPSDSRPGRKPSSSS